MSFMKQSVAEFVGTFTLVYVGAGSIKAFIFTGSDPGTDAAALVGVALAHGLALAVMVTATAHISGGHLNPAVTLGLFAGGRVKPLQAVVYIISQLLGGAVAAALLVASFPATVAPEVGTPTLGQGVTTGEAILIEAVLTFFLVFVVAGTAVDDRSPARIGGLAIGFTLALDILMGGRLTGAAVNPARHFGPALVASFWVDWYVYWIGPLLGGLVAGILYSYFLMEARGPERAAGHDHSSIEKEG
jgi:MIP family channel proteins